MEGAVQGRTGDWGKVVTRYPYENVGMDHLLSMEKKIKQLQHNPRFKTELETEFAQF